MIIAYIDRTESSAKLLLRGKEWSYWLEQIFYEIPFHSLTQNPGSFTFILIFQDERVFKPFLKEKIEGISDFLLHRNSPKEEIFSFPGYPFLAASYSLIANSGKSIKPGIFQELITLPFIQYFPIFEPVQISNPNSEPLKCEQIIIDFQARYFRENGIQIMDLNHFYIEGGIPIGQHSIIASGVVIRGKSSLGQHVQIYPHCYIENSSIGDHCTLFPGTIIIDSEVESHVQLGPYCHLRMGTQIKKGAKVGNFVEIKKSQFGEESKAMHLSYIGDATIGKKVNIGAGTITCNFDGVNKNPTFIEDGAFIGSGTELIAPVTIHQNSYVAAGSTITDEVPENALAIARERQRNIEGWALRKKSKKKQ